RTHAAKPPDRSARPRHAARPTPPRDSPHRRSEYRRVIVLHPANRRGLRHGSCPPRARPTTPEEEQGSHATGPPTPAHRAVPSTPSDPSAPSRQPPTLPRQYRDRSQHRSSVDSPATIPT